MLLLMLLTIQRRARKYVVSTLLLRARGWKLRDVIYNAEADSMFMFGARRQTFRILFTVRWQSPCYSQQ